MGLGGACLTSLTGHGVCQMELDAGKFGRAMLALRCRGTQWARTGGTSSSMDKFWSTSGWCLAVFLFAGVLSACSSPERKELPVPIQYNLFATEDVNPSVSGRPSPVVVRLYELRNSPRFLAADYFSLVQDDRAALGDEFVSRQEYVLRPGETRLIRKNADLTTRFIGVVASYRDIENGVWRALTQIPAPHRSGVLWSGTSSPEHRLLVTVDRRTIQLVDEQAIREREAQ